MKEEIRKEILYDLAKVIEIMAVKETKDLTELKEISNHAIDDVAAHKDLDLISITVLIYSIYKIASNLNEEDYQSLLSRLQEAKDTLLAGDLGKYNRNVRIMYELVTKCNAKVKMHLQDVMQAARIKKGTALLEHGLSIGQAAGLMGLSNWDLQQYVSKTIVLEHSHEAIPARQRLGQAYKIFGVKA